MLLACLYAFFTSEHVGWIMWSCLFRPGLFRGWFPVVNSICCSNFVYFYVFNSLKAVSYPKGVKGYPSKDLVLAYLAGNSVGFSLK